MAAAIQVQPHAAARTTWSTTGFRHQSQLAAQPTVCLVAPSSSAPTHRRGRPSRLAFGAAPAPQKRRAVQCLATFASEEQATIPDGYNRYETMLVLRPDMTDEERDVELAKFETFLNNEECKQISAFVRGIQQLAYPIKGYWDGTYVLYRFAARPKTSPKIQLLLSRPIAGSESNVLRHITFRL